MIFAYFIMGPEIVIDGRPESIMDTSVNKDNGVVAKETVDKHRNCVSNFQDDTFAMDTSLVERTTNGLTSQDEVVDVADITKSAGNELVESKYQEATESSSSFDSVSGVENDPTSGDVEVVSDILDDATSALGCDGVLRMRKRKLTPHWRAFVQPLLWRCKWVELQVNKLKLQERKYDRRLADYKRRKQSLVENLMKEGFSMKSVQFPSGGQRDKLLKRKKRRRSEDTEDMTTYMSRHNLFSYYENKNITIDGASFDNDWGNRAISAEEIGHHDKFGPQNELLWLDSIYGDEPLEQILRQIGALQGHVSELKTRLDKVMSVNAGMFSYADKTSMLVPCNALTGSARDSASPRNNGDRTAVGSSYIASQLMSQYNKGDMVLPESAVSSHGETGDDILIFDERVKEEMTNFDEVKIQPVEKHEAAGEPRRNAIPPALVDPELPADDRPSPKIRSISKLTAPKSKKRKGRRRSGFGKRRRS